MFPIYAVPEVMAKFESGRFCAVWRALAYCQTLTRCSGGRYMVSPGFTPDAWYQSPKLRTMPLTRYLSGEYGSLSSCWRTAEVLRHAAWLARQLGADAQGAIRFAGRYTGLAVRELISCAKPGLRRALD